MRFFEPDDELVQSIVDYANGRIIFDIGFGDGDLLKELHAKGARVAGVEMFLDEKTFNDLRIKHGLQVFPGRVEDYKFLISKLEDKGLLLFARPCHSRFVENTLDFKNPDTEALYITVPENLELYDDLGKHKTRAKRIKLRGTSVDNEVIYSIW